MKLQDLIKNQSYKIQCGDWSGVAQFLGEIDYNGNTAPVADFLCDDGTWGCFSEDEIIGPVSENDEIKDFAREIKEKLKQKCSGKGSLSLFSIPDLVAQMVEHKMKKEGWKK